MAKPTPLPLGRANPHIMQSRGAEPHIMNFYCTSYSTTFTKPNTENNKGKFIDIPAYSGGEVFKPRSAPQYKNTGFISNERPQIFYNNTLDRLDNPQMGRICAENYQTMTNLQFQPFKLKDGTEDLPVQVLDQRSAFTKEKPYHNPRPSDVANLYIDTKIKAPYDVLPKHVPLLHRLNNKDPLPRENEDYGVNYMSTEYEHKFQKPERKEVDKNHSAIGPKEVSGFVTNKDKDILSYFPGERWLMKTRPTGTTNYHDKFQPYDYSRGDDTLPNITGLKATNDTAHNRSILPTDINPRSHHFGNPSEYTDEFKGQQRMANSLSEKIGSAIVGPKEDSGQSRSEKGFVQHLDDPKRFITNYQMKHFDMNPKGKDREGYVCGGVNGARENAYTTDIKFHEPGKINTYETLKNADSYQSRSIRARDNYYDDHSHDHKFNIKNNIFTQQDNNQYSVKISCT